MKSNTNKNLDLKDIKTNTPVTKEIKEIKDKREYKKQNLLDSYKYDSFTKESDAEKNSNINIKPNLSINLNDIDPDKLSISGGDLMLSASSKNTIQDLVKDLQ
jgi:hypothetical protein